MTTIRIYFRGPDGQIEDGQQDFDLSSFAGFLPAVGDVILDPGVLRGLERHLPANRNIWTVVQRVFNPKDNDDYVALVVEAHVASAAEIDLLP